MTTMKNSKETYPETTYRHLISVNGFASSAMIPFLSLQQQELKEA
jgi:hypothetical protein